MSRHWPFGVLLMAGVVLRGCAWLAYRPALAYIDTPRYLGHDGGGLDPLGYSYLLLRPVLLAGGGLAGVTAIQHLLGLAMAMTTYALLTRRGVNRWLAAAATAPVLLDAYQVVAEQMIMPDVLFEALIAAATAILLMPRHPGARSVACGAVVLGLSATVRQVGEVLIGPALGYMFAAAPGWRAGTARALAGTAAFALPVVAYMALSASLGVARRRRAGDQYQVPAAELRPARPGEPGRDRPALRHGGP
ncbi:MAG: glycosyltransferase family 2 protein [Actinomycetia bacterium]|nr:glycosyltransferase family 2 protein [Actinomycetes bacterium]